MFTLDHDDLVRYIQKRFGVLRWIVPVALIHLILDMETEYLVDKGIAELE